MSGLTIKRDEAATYLTINRPEALNALNSEVLRDLQTQIPQIETPIAILTGGGNKAFVSGADVKEMAKMSENEWKAFCNLGNEVMDLLESAPFVSIAAVNGYCLGGGLELALACDFILCNEKAVFGMPEAKLGVIPSFGGVKRLSAALGERRAKEWMFTGRHFLAEDARFVNRVCSDETLLSECQSLAKEIAKCDFGAVLAIKRKESYYFNKGAFGKK